jgi:crotonobetainyl-CoA:carnitine CoA-transferase CaiB-like acyl-CoA transferase
MRIDAPIAQASMWTIAENIALATNVGGGGWPPFASRAVYRCADGRLVTLAANEQRSWDVLVEALDLPELAGPPIGGDEDAKRASLAARFAEEPAARWLEHPGLAGGVGPVNQPGELLDDPQVVARGGATRIDGTDHRILANPLLLRDPSGPVPTTVTAPPPAIGEHNEVVLADAGFTTDEVATLIAEGVVVPAR